MKTNVLQHPDWTEEKCVGCGTTLTEQELQSGMCIVCGAEDKTEVMV